MNWTEFATARQLLAEETLGRAIRRIEAAEDSEFADAVKALGG